MNTIVFNMTAIEVLVGVVLVLVISGLVLFYMTLYQILKHIDNIEMFDGGDIIGIGDTADEINPDKTTSTMETISRNSTYGAFPTTDASPTDDIHHTHRLNHILDEWNTDEINKNK